MSSYLPLSRHPVTTHGIVTPGTRSAGLSGGPVGSGLASGLSGVGSDTDSMMHGMGGGGGSGGAGSGGGSGGGLGSGAGGGGGSGLGVGTGVMDTTNYMEHFLNIPDICPTGYRNTRAYYMGGYTSSDACRMEALQHHQQQLQRSQHDLRMGLHHHHHHHHHQQHNNNLHQAAGRAAHGFYPNMNMSAAMRFGDSMDAQMAGSNCLPQSGRVDTLSPCTKGVGIIPDAETPSFYPWMSIVGEYPQSVLSVRCCCLSQPQQ
ncbi:homeobox hox lox2 [Plakobranchus ocellatus]|uniref:Homeobox hox lox2 n=1 Tax=Plakobranchus ocellatus TaxID=259542 RepID=A0AAV4BGS8_9GAST|nr:homeobox hox lox2 [Plakobranchus ocellatus]